MDRVKECHAVSLAQLATEQDRLYHQLEELRSVNDVIEEVLDKANPYQLQAAYSVCLIGVKFFVLLVVLMVNLLSRQNSRCYDPSYKL